MPLSPFTRLLTGLTLLAFAGVFVWFQDQSAWIPSTILGVALTLLVVTILLVIRGSGAFDDRAFHRTRPSGDSRAFRHSTQVMLGLALAVTLMAVARGLILNLGIRSTTTAAGIVFISLALLTAALATAFTLISDRSGTTRRVLVVMLALPLVLYFLLLESRWLQISLGPRRYTDWTTGITTTALIGAVGFMLTWWLAARHKRWAMALAVSGVIAAYLPIMQGRGVPLEWTSRALPVAGVTLTRGPRVEHPPLGKEEKSEKPGPRWIEELHLPIDGRLTATGLRGDEFMTVRQLYPGARVTEGYIGVGSSGWGSGVGILRSGDPPNSHRALLDYLARQVSGLPKLMLEEEDDLTGNWVSVKEDQASLEALEQRPWWIDEVVYRLEDAGSFEVTRGGSHRLESGGVVQAWPAFQNRYNTTIQLRLILPEGQSEDDDILYSDPMTDFNHRHKFRALLVDQRTSRAWIPRLSPNYASGSRQQGLGSRWQHWSLDLSYARKAKRSGEEILRSRLYLFTATPVAKVHASLPPP